MDETSTAHPQRSHWSPSFVWQKNSMTHLLPRVHIKRVGLIGRRPCHSNIRYYTKEHCERGGEAGHKRARRSCSMLNGWILMTPILFRRQGAAQKWGGRWFLCTSSSASLLCHSYLHLLGPLPSFFLSLPRIHIHQHAPSHFLTCIRSLHVPLILGPCSKSWTDATARITT